MCRLFAIAPIVLFILTGVPASADILVFTDEAAFLAAAGPLGFESFEDTDPGFTGTSRVLDALIAGAVEPFDSLEIIDNPVFAAHGDQSLGNARGIGFFGFVETPNVFGLTVYDFGNAGANTLRLELYDSSSPFATIPLATNADTFQEFRFFGVISSRPFHTVEIHHDNVDDFLTVDAVRFGHSVIPEPGTVGLVALGLAGLAVRGRGRGRGIEEA